jgi:hypothetical protein
VSIQVVLIQGMGPFDIGNYWKLHENIERMRAWVQITAVLFLSGLVHHIKKISCCGNNVICNRSWHDSYIPSV